MYDTAQWSSYHRAKKNRRKGIVLTVLGLLAAVGGFWLASVIPSPPPPPPVTTADLRQVDRPDSLRHPYISFDCPQVVETGVVLSGRGHRNRPWTAYYYLLPVEDRFIVATSDKPILPGKIQGRIVRWDMPVNVSALQQVHTKRPAYAEYILPVQLDVGDYTEYPSITGWPLLFVVVGVLGGVMVLFGLANLVHSGGASSPPPATAPQAQWSFLPPPR